MLDQPVDVSRHGRDLNLDFVKGFLVVVMALYHAMNYFAVVPSEVYGYLRFANGSFVFMAGYAVALFYTRSAATQSSIRLVTRGAKLLALFTALNVALSAFSITNYRQVTFGLADYLNQLGSIYGSGDAPQIAFRILVPIAYVLMLSGLFLLSAGWQKMLIALTFSAALLHSAFASSLPPNVFFMLTGLMGLALGLLLKTPTFEVLAMRPRALAVMVSVVGFVALASVMNTLSSNVLAYSVGLGLMLALVYGMAKGCNPNAALYSATVLLGSYSLVAYVGQIGYLFLLHRAVRGLGLAPGLALAFAFLSTCVFLWVGCKGLEALRQRSRLVEQTYRMVFA
jgi:OpgC protein